MDYKKMTELAKENGIKFAGVKKTDLETTLKNKGIIKEETTMETKTNEQAQEIKAIESLAQVTTDAAKVKANELAANEVEKAKLKAEKEAEKAELKAKKEAEKAELKAKKEIEKAEKLAAKEKERELKVAERKAKKEAREAEIAAKKFDYSKLPDGLVDHGRRGVTNAQMIPAMKKALETDNIEGLKILKTNFPAVYESTIKYLAKDYKAKLELLAI